MFKWNRLFTTMARRMFEWFIRINEYTTVYWYTSFRMKQKEVIRNAGRNGLRGAIKQELTVDFLLTISKGLNNEQFRPTMDFLTKMRYESSFMREGNRIKYLYDNLVNVHNFTGNLVSSPVDD